MAAYLIIGTLAAIIYEDFRFRAIHWYWLVLLGIFAYCYSTAPTSDIFANFGFLFIQIAGLTAYFSIKNKRLVNIVDAQIGLGDILFFIPLCLLFKPTLFLAFFVISLLGSLIGFLLIQKFWLKKLETIPLAGCMSIFLLLFLFLEYPQNSFFLF